jgi:hypothetical protein
MEWPLRDPRRKAIMETPLSSEIETRISIGNAIEIYRRAIYPVARTTVLKRYGDLVGCWITPLAVLIIEQDNAYAISLTEEKITLDQVLTMAPSLNEIVEKGTHVRTR